MTNDHALLVEGEGFFDDDALEAAPPEAEPAKPGKTSLPPGAAEVLGFGVLMPLAMLALDPVVFKGPGMFESMRPLVWGLTGLAVVALLSWHFLRRLPAMMNGLLMGGAAFAFMFGVFMAGAALLAVTAAIIGATPIGGKASFVDLPVFGYKTAVLELWPTLVVLTELAALAAVPFLMSWVYYRAARDAARMADEQQRSSDRAFCTGFFGIFVLALGLQAAASSAVEQTIRDIHSGDPARMKNAATRMELWKPLIEPGGVLQLCIFTSPSEKDNFVKVYRDVTGREPALASKGWHDSGI